MIAKLRGIVDTIGEDYAIIDVNGVGYLVFASSKTLAKLPRGGSASILVETVVRRGTMYSRMLMLSKPMMPASRRAKEAWQQQ